MMKSVIELFDLTGKVSLVTGGATGIGFSMAQGLAEAGSDVIICGRGRHASVDEAADKLQEKGVRSKGYICDVSNPESVNNLCNHIMDDFSCVDVLVNNAGVSWGAPAAEMPLDRWNMVLKINLTGAFYITQQVVRNFMIPKQKGSIIMISSVSGFTGGEIGISGYAASKAGLIGLTRQLAIEWADQGIRINAIAPSWFPSYMTRHFTSEDSPMRDELIKRHPMGRLGKPWELKGVTIFLASEASSYITGVCIPVDGGFLAK
ncbi:MAG: SDR family oxidoreductase [Candidatus Hodarchaeota archaeon]